MGIFERYLSVWVILGIVAGILLGQSLVSEIRVLSELNFASVVGVLIEVPVMLSLVKLANRWRY